MKSLVSNLVLLLPAVLAHQGLVRVEGGAGDVHSSVASSKGGSIFLWRLDVEQDMAGTSKKVSDKSGMKARDRRAAEFSLSVDLTGPGGKSKKEIKKQARLSLRRKMLRRKAMREKRLKEKRLKMAKVALKLVYKDVLPVVGALAISSGEILREQVIPAMKDASARAGRVATDTIQALQEYAPLVRDALQSSMRESMDTVQNSMRDSIDTVMVGMKKASVGVSAAAKEFQSKYSSALTRLRAKQAKKVERHRLRTSGQDLDYGGARNIVPR